MMKNKKLFFWELNEFNFDFLKNKSEELNLDAKIIQSNIEGDLVNVIQDARNKFDGIINLCLILKN